MSSLFRDDLDAIPAYIPGRSIPGAIKISSNEVTDAPDQSIIDAVATAVAGGNRYPDTSSKELRTAIAAALTQDLCLSLIHISEPTRRLRGSRMPSSA